MISRLLSLVEKGYWVQVSPLASIENEEWIVGIYRKGKTAWVTELCKSGFNTPTVAYLWAFEHIENNYQFKTK